MPEIPDFTRASWHKRRSDAQLLASILDGKGTAMPPLRNKVTREQARRLVGHVRTFAPTLKRPRQGQQEEPARGNFDARYRRLQKQMDSLKRQFRELPEVAPRTPSRQAESPPHPAPSRSSSSPPPPVAQAASATGGVRNLFRQHCVKCHGGDGTGSAARKLMPEIPDFTRASWHKRRSDAQLLTSILDGKGTAMPPLRNKVTREQARRLVGHVRTFAPATKKPPQKQQEQPILAEPPELTEPPSGYSGKLLGWLGKFHPAAVHFPIALLPAAALAELLRMATGRPAFDAISRYCVWFGSLTAVAACVLGWFQGGFRLTDASWVMTAHRWLGTATAACSMLVLLVREVRPLPDRPSQRRWLRAAVLVVAGTVLVTGFFGGAVVFGLDHYAWPQ
jgi:mono/diheme cytochrome c family protein/uncharacterized membrane protein